MIERAPPKVGDTVWFYSYSRPKPGPYEAKVIFAQGQMVDVELTEAKAPQYFGVLRRGVADGNVMWDWPAPKGLECVKGGSR